MSRRSPWFVALLVAIVLAPPGPATAATAPSIQLTLPAPTGPHRVGTVSMHLVDRSRPDPWVPAQRTRELMIQVWYPAATVRHYPKATWLTPATARGYEKSNHLPVLHWPITDAHLGAPLEERSGGWPVVLYSHGLGGERTEFTGLLEDLASHGYLVIAIDHIHDASVVELPDGRLETAAIPNLTKANELTVTTKAIEARVADTRFVLDQLPAINRGDNPDAEHRPLPRGLRGALDLTRIGMMGHSDGGTTTAATMHVDPRIAVGVNLDGTFWTPAAKAGSDRPLLLFGKQNLDRVQATTWATFRANQRGPRLQLNLTGSTHSTFQDVAVLLPQAARALGIPPDKVAEVIGTINPLRAMTIVRSYVNAYFDRYLRHHHNGLLNGPSARFSEIKFTP